MHPDLAIAMYRHEEHQLEVRLEQRRSHLEKAGPGIRRRLRPHRHALRARR